MSRLRSAILATLALGLPAGSGSAAPISVLAQVRIDVAHFGAVQFSSTGVVDVSGGVYSLPAGLFSLASATVPVTSTNSVVSIVATNVSNLAGSFAPGGVSTQAPSEICAAPISWQACVSGGGLGGVMGLAGVIQLHVVPHVVVLPLDLAYVRLGLSESGSSPFTADGAPWTTGIVRIGGADPPFSTVLSRTGSVGTGSLSLVSGSFVLFCGNLLPFTARLTLTSLVPEPAALALLAIGVAGLIGVARKAHPPLEG